MKKVSLKISLNSQENTCASVYGVQHRCFCVNFTNFLRTPFSQNSSGRLLLLLSIFLSVDAFLAITFTVGLAWSFVIVVSLGRDVGHIVDLYTEFCTVSTLSSRSTNASFRLFVSLGLLSPRKLSCNCCSFWYSFLSVYKYSLQLFSAFDILASF